MENYADYPRRANVIIRILIRRSQKEAGLGRKRGHVNTKQRSE